MRGIGLMRLRDHPDWHDVVARHWQDTTRYLLAFCEPCITIRDEEIAAIQENRVLVDLDASHLGGWRPEGSWLLAVILCPGDALAPLLSGLAASGAEPGRVHFYARPETDVSEDLQSWGDAGLPWPRVTEGIDSWERLHRRFGLDLSIQILADRG